MCSDDHALTIFIRQIPGRDRGRWSAPELSSLAFFLARLAWRGSWRIQHFHHLADQFIPAGRIRHFPTPFLLPVKIKPYFSAVSAFHSRHYSTTAVTVRGFRDFLFSTNGMLHNPVKVHSIPQNMISAFQRTEVSSKVKAVLQLPLRQLACCFCFVHLL